MSEDAIWHCMRAIIRRLLGDFSRCFTLAHSPAFRLIRSEVHLLSIKFYWSFINSNRKGDLLKLISWFITQFGYIALAFGSVIDFSLNDCCLDSNQFRMNFDQWLICYRCTFIDNTSSDTSNNTAVIQVN